MSLFVFPFGKDYEWFWVMCQCVALVCTFFFIWRQIKLQNDSHLVNSFAILGDRWKSPMMLVARRDICLRSKGPDNPLVLDGTVHHLCLFFEELGAFCSQDVLDPEIVWEIYSFEIEHYWIIIRKAVFAFREEQGDRTFFYHFEKLHKRTSDLSLKKGASVKERTKEDIASFAEYELETVNFFLNSGARGLPKEHEFAS
ncbi:MAG TPA: hypothetical protein VGS07_06505 [Thermoanaerobaculia bacterium]|nr:hypothetical protein [Thermoanaerobaculia bacterium]